MPVVNGCIEEVNAAANGGDHGIAIGNIGNVVRITQVGAEAQSRELQAVELPIKATLTGSGMPGSQTRSSLERGKALIHPSIVSERAIRPSETYSESHFKPNRGRFPFARADVHTLESEYMSTSQATQQQPNPSKMILVLDDEAEVRKLVAAVLSRNGYKVLTADNGDNAIKAFKKSKHPVDLLLLDVVSPGLSGPMVADRIVESQPGVRVLFMSGYDHTNVVQRYVVEKGYALLTKPFTPDQLAKKVREVMDAPAPGTH